MNYNRVSAIKDILFILPKDNIFSGLNISVYLNCPSFMISVINETCTILSFNSKKRKKNGR